MKILRITLFLILLPFTICSQTSNKIEISDTVIDVRKLLIKKFGEEIIAKIQQLESIGNLDSYGIFEFKNIIDKKTEYLNEEFSEVPSGCQCYLTDNRLQILNSKGFMAGITHNIEIDFRDSTFETQINFHTDGGELHKYNRKDDFIEDFELSLESAQLLISSDSEFTSNGLFKGKLIGTSTKYFEKEYSQNGDLKEIQLEVLSVFECKIQDHDMIKSNIEKKVEESKRQNNGMKN